MPRAQILRNDQVERSGRTASDRQLKPKIRSAPGFQNDDAALPGRSRRPRRRRCRAAHRRVRQPYSSSVLSSTRRRLRSHHAMAAKRSNPSLRVCRSLDCFVASLLAHDAERAGKARDPAMPSRCRGTSARHSFALSTMIWTVCPALTSEDCRWPRSTTPMSARLPAAALLRRRLHRSLHPNVSQTDA